jgi:16S rRNA (guanine527-N7)-methyltransferase
MNRKRPRQTGKNHVNRPDAKHPAGGQGPKRNGAAKTPHGAPEGVKWTGPRWEDSRKAASRPAKPWDPKRSPSDPRRNSERKDGPRFAPPSRDARPMLPKSAPRSMTPRPGTPGKSGRPSSGTSWGHTAPPSRARLEELLVSHGVQLPAATLDKVWQYHQILRRNNHDLDLTRLIGFETIVQRHYADCMMLHKMMKGNWPSTIVDIGTGAGFPGMMIKIASPSTEVILSEPRNVRVDFLNNTIQELGLKGISVFGHKFTSKSFTTPVRGAITRAFEPISKTLPRLQNALQVGGLAMFMKGPGVDEELSGPIPPGYKLVRDERYRIPKTTLDRAFIVFERTA